MLALRRQARYGTKKDGRIVRDYLKDYYNSPSGSVHWQEAMVERQRGGLIFNKNLQNACIKMQTFCRFFFLQNK